MSNSNVYSLSIPRTATSFIKQSIQLITEKSIEAKQTIRKLLFVVKDGIKNIDPPKYAVTILPILNKTNYSYD